MKKKITIIPINDNLNEYAEEISDHLTKHVIKKFDIILDTSTDKFGKRVREAQKEGSFVCLIGSKEQEKRNISILHNSKELGLVEELVEFDKMVEYMNENKSNDTILGTIIKSTGSVIELIELDFGGNYKKVVAFEDDGAEVLIDRINVLQDRLAKIENQVQIITEELVYLLKHGVARINAGDKLEGNRGYQNNG